MNFLIKSVIFCLFTLSSCTVKLHLPEGEAFPEQLARKYLQRLDKQYPSSFQLTQRILLTVSDKEYDFIGSLTVKGDSVFRAVALGEMGGTFLDIQYDSGHVKILKNPGNMPAHPLNMGVGNDILHLFATSWKCHDFESSLRGDLLYLQLNESQDRSTLLTFEQNNLIASEQKSGHRVLRRVQYSNFKKIKEFNCPLPQRILIENKKWHYSMKIDLLKINKLAE